MEDASPTLENSGGMRFPLTSYFCVQVDYKHAFLQKLYKTRRTKFGILVLQFCTKDHRPNSHQRHRQTKRGAVDEKTVQTRVPQQQITRETEQVKERNNSMHSFDVWGFRFLLYLTLTLLNDELYGIFVNPPPVGVLPEFRDIPLTKITAAEWELETMWQNTLQNLPEDLKKMECSVHENHDDCANDHDLDTVGLCSKIFFYSWVICWLQTLFTLYWQFIRCIWSF